MIKIIRNIHNFIFILRLKIKLLSDDEFSNLLKELDYTESLYAIYFRYV